MTRPTNARPTNARQLNARQERFINEYLLDQNAAAAAIRAGYAASTKGTHAAELMRNPLICERINEAMSKMFIDLGITAQELLREQARLAYFDPACLFDGEGNPIPLHQLPLEIRRLLTVSYDTRSDGSTILRVRMPNKQQALSVLEKRCAQFMELQMALLQTQIELAEGQVDARDEEAQEEDDAWVPPPLDVPNFRGTPATPPATPDRPVPAQLSSTGRGLINAASQFLRGKREGEQGAAWSGVSSQPNEAPVGAASRVN